MVAFKYRMKRLRTIANEEAQGELPLKSKVNERYITDREEDSKLGEKSSDSPDEDYSQNSQSTIESKNIEENMLEMSLLRRFDDFIEIMTHLKLDIKPGSFRDDENLLNYCFLISKPYKNNSIGFTFHVAMENIVSGRPRVLSQSMSMAIEYICCTKFPLKLLHGEVSAINSPFKVNDMQDEKSLFKISHLPLLKTVKEQEYSSGLFIVLDMDETLVHCTNEMLKGIKPDLLVNIAAYSSPWFVYYRPFLKFFLKNASKLGKICVFTASTREYAEQVINSIDPTHDLIKYKLFREHCTVYNKGYMKDLRIIQGVDLKRTVLVDNSLISNTLQLDNAIPVDSWYGCTKDNELLRLLVLLNRIQLLNDVRPYLANRYGIREWINLNRTKDNLMPI
ncbi:NLI interacting factor ctd-like phosphatase [Cryptosporidium ubiquitum]|uniref:NLI interacting factor ctd-like phosphatase n=1 Tax=Cryptosporidium ubiquitum TaxID=857276 RepID=A0A1J4MD36_9CRYT|nr:NLI interacting factor ctd-like phosphatase [Cryptosporidium ubiquitum]OII72152.1 NLI interacting factor ctd-like phosphatase [Cryptosporidium ubiquitum]